jgi:hypothetical protein
MEHNVLVQVITFHDWLALNMLYLVALLAPALLFEILIYDRVILEMHRVE